MADLNKIIEDLSSLTVVEAAELSKQLEEKWGVTPMAAAAPAAAGGAAPAEDKDEFTIMLVSAGDKKINVIKEIRFPHSLGLLYSAFTYYTGFKVNSGEYKLMGLAPYGIPKYADLI